MTTDRIGMTALGSGDLELADEADDVRGLSVLDARGRRIGVVGDVVIDEVERRARLLVVAPPHSGDSMDDRRLVPVEAVARVGRVVRLNYTRDDVQHGFGYDPASCDAPEFAGVYRYYGYTPFWHADYVTHYFHDRRT